MHAAKTLLLPLLLLTLAPAAPASDLLDLNSRSPDVEFDFPPKVFCRDVTTDSFTAARPGRRLIEVELPISVVVFRGDADRVRNVVIEISGAGSGLSVYDYAPATQLSTDFVEPIETTSTDDKSKHLDASLGANLPLAGAIAHITPGVSTGVTSREATTETRKRLAPKEAVVVSGTTGGRKGVFFKLQQSSQTTLEGEHLLKITFDAPADWQAGELSVTGVARGVRRMLFVEKAAVWHTSESPLNIELAAHVVAKPVVQE
ncbi:hypothetical protein Pla175_41090 [Pirellulimonas nuda]|uniref:Uncharacterized protein n=1 Tax=Pirellulimonas nuda TaxID=2528009 RepID=A0A518DGU7_9BACT|nr:hypothetical protein [Pirellulimonas nuda]QDU90699.1 hypothetical protein Pla175_41090 [Pirellulimonas nuda]